MAFARMRRPKLWKALPGCDRSSRMFHGREHDQRDQLSDEAIVQCHVSGTAQNMAQPGEIRSHDAVAFIHCLILGFDTFNTGKQQTRDAV